MEWIFLSGGWSYTEGNLPNALFYTWPSYFTRSLGKTLEKYLPNCECIISQKTFFFIVSERGNFFWNHGLFTDAFAFHLAVYGSSAKLCLDRSVSSETNQLVNTMSHIKTQWLAQERFKSFGRKGPLGHCIRTVDREDTGSKKRHLNSELAKYEIRAGLSGVRDPAGSREFYLLPNAWTGSGAHLACYSFGTGILSQGQSGRSAKLSTHFHILSAFKF